MLIPGADGPRLFASLDSFLPPVPGHTLAGRGVANHQFLLALMRYGSFEAYHFFLPTPEELRAFRTTYGAQAPGGASISSLPRRQLIERLEDTPYTVFHLANQSDWFQGLCSLRNERAGHPFPVTALIHDISDQANMNAYLAMGLAGPRPYDAIICTSDSGRNVLRACFNDLLAATGQRIQPPLSFPMRLPALPLGIDAAAMAQGDRARGRALARIPIDRTVLLYVGRFSAHDKMDVFPLLQAFSRLRNKPGGESLTLMMAGSRQGTPYVDMIQMWAQALGISDDVALLTDFDEESKPDIYAAADIFISPCDNPQETFGLTVVEAMAAGCPVVVSDYDGYREAVPEQAGIRIPTYSVGISADLSDMAPLSHRRSTHLRLGQGTAIDLRALTDALADLIANPGRRDELGRAAARHAERQYDWANVIPQYEVLWDELSAEAVAYWQEGPSRHNPLRLDYNRVFEHYPTRALRDDEQLVCTPLGQAFVKTGRYPVYPEMAPVLELGHAVVVVREAANPVSFKRLVDVLGAQSVEVARARRTVLWALKHGLLELC